MLTLYGIPNCDSCRNARKFLDQAGIEFRFHDLREDGIERQMLERWMRQVDWKKLLNSRSATWRGVPDSDRADIDQEKALALMLEHPTLVKRPVLERGRQVIVGFSKSEYEKL